MSLAKFLNNYVLKQPNNYLIVTTPYIDTLGLTKNKEYKLKVLNKDSKVIQITLDREFIGSFDKIPKIKEILGNFSKIEAFDFSKEKPKLLESSVQKPELKQSDEGYKAPLYSNMDRLLNPKPKPFVESLLPNEEFAEMMRNKKEKDLLRQRRADANIIHLVRTFYTQEERRDVFNRNRERYLALRNISRMNLEQVPLGVSVFDNIQQINTNQVRPINSLNWIPPPINPNDALSGIDLSHRNFRTQQELKKNIEALPGPKVDPNFTIEFGPDCSICMTEMESTEKLCKLGCGHTYHCDCISKWLKMPLSDYGREIKGVCAMCRAPVESITTNEPNSEKSSFGLSSELKYLLSL
jgi:hypothetical protein